MNILELAERCERASGPDRELGREVLLACGRGYVSPLFSHDNPTASLDAALTLVGDNSWRVEDHELAGPCALVCDFDAYAATPALALCAAALRALATTREQSNHD